ncbi:hypothetical protein KIL84_015890 [Mauremys mutica]|uniref:Uncharacterized protein n=1 Tax=Mauremys mutica TaxID=74926 RepID=A0A9D3WSV5_9SAUR|nr:hypothetical protein KIL84_015890 [Mauremys mutica]
MQLLYGKLKIIKLKGFERHNMCWRCGSLLRSPSAGIADESQYFMETPVSVHKKPDDNEMLEAFQTKKALQWDCDPCTAGPIKFPHPSMQLREIEEEEELEELGQSVNKARQANRTVLKKCSFYDGGQEKNGILPWNTAEETREWSRKNESVQQNLEGNLETILPFYRSEASNFFLLLIEDSAEDFDTELSLFNELSISSDLVSSPQYLPYYRTHEEFFINPVSLDTLLIRTEVEEGDIRREKREGSGGCKVNTVREDETLSNLVISTGYFPYYRSYEEHFGSPVLHDGLSITAEGKEANRESNEKRGDVCEGAVGCSDKSIPKSYETEKEAISSMPSAEPSGSLLLTDGITENCGSEISLLNGLSRLNQPFSPTGYFPYYRTYGELISPASHDGSSTSSTEVRVDVGSETTEKGKSRWDFSGSCAVC